MRSAPRAAEAQCSRVAITALLVAVVLAQGLIYSVHSGIVLSRADTRTLTRNWMLAHIPAGTRVVVEPVSPDGWGRATGPSTRRLFDRLAPRRTRDGRLEPRFTHEVGLEDYERTLRPALIDYYEQEGYCWVITGSTRVRPRVRRIHARCRRRSPTTGPSPNAAKSSTAPRRTRTVGRTGPRRETVPFNFDWSFDYYPSPTAAPGRR